MRTVALVLFAVLLGSVGTAAPVPKHLMKDADGATDRAALEGTWELATIARDGEQLSDDITAAQKIAMAFRGTECVIKLPVCDQIVTATVSLDATAKPRRMSFANEKVITFAGKPLMPTEKQMHAVIYKIDGDTLTLGSHADRSKPPETPPAEFAEKSGSGVVVMTFRKMRK